MTPRAPEVLPFPLRCLYGAAAALLWPFLYLYYRLRVRIDGKYAGNFRQRLGLDLPGRAPGRARPIWVHALSVGETLSVVPLVEALKKERPEADILFSGATAAGLEIARTRLAPWVETFFYLPHDFPWAVELLVQRLKPGLFVLVETDLWPALLDSLRRRGVATALVNARLSPGSFRRLSRLKPFFSTIVNGFDLVLAQSQQDRLRFEALGVPANRCACEGNLKFDAAFVAAGRAGPSALRISGGIEENRPVWIAGSTHAGEEEEVLSVHRELLSVRPGLLLILAPRDIRRGPAVASLCDRFALPAALRSMKESARGKAVYLLDTMGELGAFYAVADAAFIGGSLVPFGGHNPLEAVVRGVPAVWGPHLFNFREMEDALLNDSCCRRIASREELLDVLKSLLKNRDESREGKEAMPAFLRPHLGAGERIARLLARLAAR